MTMRRTTKMSNTNTERIQELSVYNVRNVVQSQSLCMRAADARAEPPKRARLLRRAPPLRGRRHFSLPRVPARHTIMSI
jgi:hypothetical protein